MPCSISDGPQTPEDVPEDYDYANDTLYDEWVQRKVDAERFTQPPNEGKIEDVKENPKLIRALKDGKAPLEHLVTSVWPGDARVHKSGADKYGTSNWLVDKILASTYKGAILRHLKAWAEGEDIDPESGENHLYHIRACCAIVLDSGMHGTLIDDRNKVESKDQG